MWYCAYLCVHVWRRRRTRRRKEERRTTRAKRKGSKHLPLPKPSFPSLWYPSFIAYYLWLSHATTPRSNVRYTRYNHHKTSQFLAQNSHKSIFAIETKFLNDINGVNKHIWLSMFLYCIPSDLLISGFSCWYLILRFLRLITNTKRKYLTDCTY